MTNEKLMFKEIRELCMVNGRAIDKIAKDTNISQSLVAKMLLITMQTVLDDMAKEQEE